jgi:probable HAF family extracellular repeat protein
VVGNSETTTPGQGSAFLWQKGRMTALGSVFAQYNAALASAINDHGQTVGIFATLDGASHHAYIWDHHTLTDLGVGHVTASDTYGMNNRGQVIGGTVQADNMTTHACVWQHGVLQVLQTFPGDQGSFANGINDAGLIVGISFTGQAFARAVLWRNAQAIDVNTLLPAGSGWHLDSAYGINLQGQIVGQGTSHGRHLAFLLTPRP